MRELIKAIAAASLTMAERRRLDAGPLEKPHDPGLDRKIEIARPGWGRQGRRPGAASAQSFIGYAGLAETDVESTFCKIE